MSRAPWSRLVLVLVVLGGAGSAGAAGVRVGADAAMLLRDEGSGHRSPIAAIAPRVGYAFDPRWSVSLHYLLGYAAEGTVARATSFHHRLSLRPEFAFPTRSAAFVLGAGPALSVVQTRFFDRGVPSVASTQRRVGAVAGAAFEVRLPRGATLRAGVDSLWVGPRWDLVFSVGAHYDFGGRT